MRNHHRMVIYLLIAVFAVALTLRLWGIGFGLPYLYHFDEHFYVNTALHLGRGVLNNPPYNPTGLSNILFPQYGAYYIVGKLLDTFPSPLEFEAAYRSDPTEFFVVGRLTTSILGAATTLALFLLARAAAGTRTGLIAAGFLAVSFLHVRDSHYAVPDVGMAFFVVLAVGLAATGLRRGRRRDIYLAGLAGGLAVSMKWTALPVIVPVGWAALCVEQKERNSIFRRLANPTMVYAGIALALGFALTSPQILMNPTPYINHVQGIQKAAQPKPAESKPIQSKQVQETHSIDFARWSFYGRTLVYGLGVVLTALGITGALRRLVLVVKARDPMSFVVLSFLLGYVPIISTGFYWARYLMPIIPFLALFAADAVVVSWRVAMKRGMSRLSSSLAGVIIVASIAQPLASSVRHDVLLTREDTRTLAKQWIEANIPDGSKIAIDWPVHGPALSTDEQMVPCSERVYDVHYVRGAGLFAHPLAWYREQGFDYLIVTTYISNNLGFGGANPAKRAFYEALGGQLTLLQEFRHYRGDIERPFSFLDEIYGPTDTLWQRERPGPTIRIYALNSSTSETGMQFQSSWSGSLVYWDALAAAPTCARGRW